MRILERLPRETGRDFALRTIKENIIDLTLEPGSQISENELAAELGLSRTPVREALIELSKMKIVTIAPQKKSVVGLIDYDMVDESRFLRNLLECAVTELNCRTASPKDLDRLRENVRLQRFYLQEGNSERLMALDDQFHMILFETAQKSQVYELMENFSVHFDRVCRMARTPVKDLRIVQDHEEILEAIARQDAAAARELMDLHLNRYKIDAMGIREQYPQYIK